MKQPKPTKDDWIDDVFEVLEPSCLGTSTPMIHSEHTIIRHALRRLTHRELALLASLITRLDLE